MISETQQTAPRPGRPKSEEKLDSISHAAAHLFLTEGFERTSMDNIAQAAGVSKQTVYSHFQNKDDLFRSCIEGKIREYQLALDSAEHATLKSGLTTLADGYLRLLSDPRVVSMWRLVVNEAPAHQHVAQMFYQTGPKRTFVGLATFLEQHGDELNTDQYMQAARTFMALVADQYHSEVLLGLRDGISDDERKRHVKRVTQQFLKIHGHT